MVLFVSRPILTLVRANQGLFRRHAGWILIPLVMRTDSIHLYHVVKSLLLRLSHLLSQIIAEESRAHLRPQLIILIDESIVIFLFIVLMPALLSYFDFHDWLRVGAKNRSFHDRLGFLLYLLMQLSF